MSENGNNGRQSAEALFSELISYCSSDLLSEEGLRELIVRHGLTPNNDNNNALISNFKRGFFMGLACANERVNEGIIRCLLEYFPGAASTTPGTNGLTPLHIACRNKNTTRGIIQLLIDAAPDSATSVDSSGYMPLHWLCGNNRMNETDSLQSLKLLMEKYPEAVRHADNGGCLPLHIAAGLKSLEFCQVLIEAYPGSERLANPNGMLPLHCACFYNTIATVQYLYKLYPDTVNHESTNGRYPIHCAITGLSKRANPKSAIDVVRYLLDCDPNVKLQKNEGSSLLHFACWRDYDDSNIDAALEMIKEIYDAHPEAIEDHRIVSEIEEFHQHQQVQAFINSELVYARQAKDRSIMNTPDDNGQLPLHRALQNSVRLGSIKLLVKGNPLALHSPDNGGAIPLHIACHHRDSTNVIQYLIDIDTTTLGTVDREGNTALHYACRGAKYQTIAMLLDKFDAVSVSKRNAQKKLPIDLLLESNTVEDRESKEYMECIFRLLSAYPETALNFCAEVQSASAVCQS